MKKVIINILGINYNICEPKVIIYDNNNCVIVNKYTCNGKLSVCLKSKCIYKIKICYFNNVLVRRLIVSPYINNYYFNFGYSYIPNSSNINNVTFNLKDFYYSLPIEKGIINLNE